MGIRVSFPRRGCRRESAGHRSERVLHGIISRREGGVTMVTERFRLATVLLPYGLSVLLPGVVATTAQAQGIPSQAPLPPPTTPPADASGGALVVIGAFIVLLGIVIAIAAVYNMRQRREEEALQLQSRLGDALMLDSLLNGAAVVPTVHVPLWKGSSLRI